MSSAHFLTAALGLFAITALAGCKPTGKITAPAEPHGCVITTSEIKFPDEEILSFTIEPKRPLNGTAELFIMKNGEKTTLGRCDFNSLREVGRISVRRNNSGVSPAFDFKAQSSSTVAGASATTEASKDFALSEGNFLEHLSGRNELSERSNNSMLFIAGLFGETDANGKNTGGGSAISHDLDVMKSNKALSKKYPEASVLFLNFNYKETGAEN